MNTRTTARNAKTRETETREEMEWTYEEPNALEIPNPVQNRFESEGMSLRWIRINLKDADDYQNVGKKMAEGWMFVTPEEVPEMATSSIVQETGRYTGTVCRGDLALAKMPAGKYQARSRYFQEKSQQLMNAVNSQLENSSDSRMPISNNSKSSVTKGRVPSFQD
jgi:hypothetical protein